MTSPMVPMCQFCARRFENTWECESYPAGIPNALFLAGADHRLALPDDGGLRFAPQDDSATRYVDDVYGSDPTPYTGEMNLPDPAVDFM